MRYDRLEVGGEISGPLTFTCCDVITVASSQIANPTFAISTSSMAYILSLSLSLSLQYNTFDTVHAMSSHDAGSMAPSIA